MSLNSNPTKEYKNLPTQIAGQINSGQLFEQLKEQKVIGGWEIDARSRANIFALAAADEAIKNSGWNADTENEQTRSGTSIATGLAGMLEISESAISLNSSPKGYRTLNPYFIAKILPNLSSGLISIKYKLKVDFC
jgi:3-oxoacyl-[acyl-carrier-protein] synthase II